MEIQKQLFSMIKEITPPVMLPTVLKCVTTVRFFFDNNKGLYRKNYELKNSAKRKRAFLLATGPSLKNKDLSGLKGEDCFSVSNFMLHNQLEVIAPKLHFFAPYHKPLVYDEYVDWLRLADNSLPIQTGIVLSARTKKCVEDNAIFSSRRVYYLCMEKAPIFSVPDLAMPILSPQTSPIMVLPVLYYMGYEQVYLLGCDHNILKNYGGTVENFYKIDEDPRKNATSGQNWKDGIIKHLDFARNVFLQYKYYDEIFAKKERCLINCSDSSWLDFLPYESLDDVLS